MSEIFFNASHFNSEIYKWNVSAVTDMQRMFYGAHSFNMKLSTWKVSTVSDMSFMFGLASSFNQMLSAWDVSAVTDMSHMFYFATSFNQDLSEWDVSAVTDMTRMFQKTLSFNHDVSEWDVSAVTNMTAMFYGATSFNQDLSEWDVSAVLDMRFMFFRAYSFKHELCSIVWENSSANKDDMFDDHQRSICGMGITKAPRNILKWGNLFVVTLMCIVIVAWVSICLFILIKDRWPACRAGSTFNPQVSVEMSGAPLPVAEVIVRNPESDPSMTRVSVAGDTASVEDMQAIPVAVTVQT